MLSAALDLENDLSIPLTSNPSFAPATSRFLGREGVGGREGGGGASGPPALHGLPAVRTAFLGSRPPASAAAAGHRGPRPGLSPQAAEGAAAPGWTLGQWGFG